MHEGIHAKQRKPVVCPYCDKSYSRPDKLKGTKLFHPRYLSNQIILIKDNSAIQNRIYSQSIFLSHKNFRNVVFVKVPCN